MCQTLSFVYMMGSRAALCVLSEAPSYNAVQWCSIILPPPLKCILLQVFYTRYMFLYTTWYQLDNIFISLIYLLVIFFVVRYNTVQLLLGVIARLPPLNLDYKD